MPPIPGALQRLDASRAVAATVTGSDGTLDVSHVDPDRHGERPAPCATSDHGLVAPGDDELAITLLESTVKHAAKLNLSVALFAKEGGLVAWSEDPSGTSKAKPTSSVSIDSPVAKEDLANIQRVLSLPKGKKIDRPGTTPLRGSSASPQVSAACSHGAERRDAVGDRVDGPGPRAGVIPAPGLRTLRASGARLQVP